MRDASTWPFAALVHHSGLRQTELAKLCNKTPLTISRWLDGGIPTGVSAPTAHILEVVCTFLFTSVKQNKLPCPKALTGAARKEYINTIFKEFVRGRKHEEHNSDPESPTT